MKHSEVLSRIMETYPSFPFEKTCDTVKYGDIEQECTGIVTSCALTINVIREAIRLKANLIIVHEPCFYTHDDTTDWLADNEVFIEKTKLLKEHGIVVWRNHDHMHTAKPDEIFLGLIRRLGWEKQERINTEDRFIHIYEIPPVTVKDLAAHLKETLHLTSGRMVGNPDATVSRVAFCGHIFPSWDAEEQKSTRLFSRSDIDAYIAFECIEWTGMGYIRDAVQLGKAKALLQPGHFATEEPGMEYLAEKLSGVFGSLFNVTFVPSGDPWQSF